MTLTEFAVMIGTTIGSALGSYKLAAIQMVRRRRSHELPESHEPPPRTSTLPSDPMGVPGGLSEQDVRRIAAEEAARAVKHELKDYLRVEEFDAYCVMDTARRERLIEGFGELRGRLAAIQKDR